MHVSIEYNQGTARFGRCFWGQVVSRFRLKANYEVKIVYQRNVAAGAAAGAANNVAAGAAADAALNVAPGLYFTLKG
ncbi:hypothetical protein TorRG33x02_298040 [Trema orientale]|uniref:Uncharacterized protein n=1 Tax=Trema orientale TaxID=63057 RepID=A0A2P5C4K0_TREOI|nr:hypothetical protein TorRG33x02_298040 [Trema orientale]